MRLALVLCLSPMAALAVQPDEILPDAALEARAREISKELRCLVCRNENIDESNADLARDLRLLVRERLVDGDTDPEVMAFVVDRYGEYVLLTPQTNGVNLILWLAGPAMLAAGLAIAVLSLRRRADAPDDSDSLTPEETARLQQILKD
nr:cytochrome c-type biogenesis protein [Pseudoruegeria sp. SK021]